MPRVPPPLPALLLVFGLGAAIVFADAEAPRSAAGACGHLEDEPTASRASGAEPANTTKLAAPRFLFAKGGKAQASIVVSPAAGKSSRASAETLARFLQRITGAAFPVKTGDGARGIAVGTAAEFPRIAREVKLPSVQEGYPPAAQQRYRLRSHSQGVQLIGATDLAVEYAVWDFLHRLGLRQYFPGEAWEIVPHLPSTAIAVDVLEEPDYYDRRISTITVDKDIAEWTLRNRLSWHESDPPPGFRPNLPRKYLRSWVSTGHAYSYIVRDHKEVFDKHPEWLALVNGKRGPGTYFCISNPGLRAFVAKWAVSHLERYPHASSVSLEPTDGAQPCQCEACAALARGRQSNLVVLLANQAAEAIEASFPDQPKYVGLLGYGHHWRPPTIPVHDRVVVQVTSQTLSPEPGPFPPMEERLAGWAEKAKHVGAYEYLSVLAWGGWLPAVSAGSNPGYLTKVVPRYHRIGARTWLAEGSESWGSCGLGYYLTSRMLWDTQEGQRVDEITDEFLGKSFGAAKEAMREFFAAADGSDHVSPGNFNQLRARVDRMYPPLLRALRETEEPAARRRIGHFLLYTRLVELSARLHRLHKAKELSIKGVTEEGVRRAGLEVVRHAYRMRHTHMIPWDMLYREWSRAYKIRPADLVAPGENGPGDATGDDIKRIVEEVTPRYAAAPAGPAKGGKGPTVRHGDTVLFDARGFDGPSVAKGGTEGADPALAQPGSIANNATRPQDARVLRTPAGDGHPGPAAGAGCLRLFRGAGATETNVQIRFAPRADGPIVVEWMAHGDPRGDGDNAMHFILGEGSTQRVGLITRITGNVFYHHGGEYVDTGLHYDGARWQHWRLAYEPKTGRFDLTVGEGTKTGLQGKAGRVDNFVFRCGHIDTTFFVDGAPRDVGGKSARGVNSKTRPGTATTK